ncbi:MAG: hypothetical protein AVDCRST_MAG77-3618 [uncultured Chloroflexi bacterium]|uniref:Uncharacterized protein n=1 Tax=uncultured Chloroflexota bacterium TaxID=166587 RepID=A0A6J4JDM2_9CHLR|nr:MAG: hypothetical protein AVDCRST_MAG77-3618 [uncultured Chloroflexota bacterium]
MEYDGRADHVGAQLRRLLVERTHRLIELDTVLRARGEPGVLQRCESELAQLEAEVLGAPLATCPPGPDALTDAERRDWVRRHLRVLPGGAEQLGPA